MLQRISGLAILAVVVGAASYLLFDLGTALKHILIFAAVPLVLMGLSNLKRQAAVSETNDETGGWRCLSPGGMHWAGLILCAGLTLLMLYVWLFVGSSRADGATQMKILVGLMLAFGAGTLYLVATMMLARVRWNDDRIESWFGPWLRGSIAWISIERAEDYLPPGPLVVHGVGGVRLVIDTSMSGADELLHRLAPWLPEGATDVPAY